MDNDSVKTVKDAITKLVGAGDEITVMGVRIVARFGFEYEVDGEAVPSKDVVDAVMRRFK